MICSRKSADRRTDDGSSSTRKIPASSLVWRFPSASRGMRRKPRNAGYGALPKNAHEFRIPPACGMPWNTSRMPGLLPTVAWFLPVRPADQSYRYIQLEAAPLEPLQGLGVERRKGQSADASVKRGSRVSVLGSNGTENSRRESGGGLLCRLRRGFLSGRS